MTTTVASKRTAAIGRYAVFTRRSRGIRKMHAVIPGCAHTVCGLPIGTGSGLVRDGDYWGNVPCRVCWDPEPDPFDVSRDWEERT